MKLLVVGSGGREHAIIKKLRESPAAEQIYALPGNGGIAADAICVPIAAKDIDAIVRFAVEKQIDYAVIAPDDPLVLGCVDALEQAGIACFGPRRNAAMIEGSKVYAKELMKKYGIPTADWEAFTDVERALAYAEKAPLPLVIKADGLALGKGVVIAQTRAQAKEAILQSMQERKFGESGSRIVIEAFLEGVEVSVLTFTDGTTVVPMISSMDHKRAHDNDTGPNTGGMGTIAPNPYYTPQIAQLCMQKIFLPTVRALQAEGREFRGCLYFGLMLTRQGPRVIEYNCRFGDPETQVVLPLLESELLCVMQATTRGTLASIPVRWREQSACCVVLASNGYPGSYESGCPIHLPQTAAGEEIYVAGAKCAEDGLRSAGGRVLGVTAVRQTLREAVNDAYALADRVDFANGFCRRDIGQKALRILGE